MAHFYKIFIFIFLITQGITMSATLKEIQHNGTNIPVIFEKNNNLPIFNLQLVFQNSGYINDKEKIGITNLTAKVLNEGTKKNGAISFAKDLENNAISIHTSTGFETFVIEISSLKSEYKLALQYLNQLLKDPNLTKETLNKIKLLQISKLKQKENDFDYIASKHLKKIQYKNTALEFPSSGNIKHIENIKLKDIKKHLDTILNLDNLIIVAGGDLKFSEIETDLEKTLQQLKNNGKTVFNKIKSSKEAKEETILKETEQSYIYFSSPFNIDYDSKESYKAKVASFILGGSGFGSRLMEEIRVKHGLAYSAYGNIVNNKSHSHFTGYLQTKLDNTTKAKKMVSKIVNKFVKSGITEEELESAKKFLTGSEPLRTETFSQRLNRAFHLYYRGLAFDYPKQELDKINKLSVEELNNFIKKHKELNQLSFSIVTQSVTK
ncbi:M16 family metallopeptidase [Arcobacter sp. 15-2]|uniref:M16 family metallopeptidase n=1 Tax=Arcobacter sp. 15-2 TaxID=3374109 RepID=UPI00399CF2D5